MRTVTIDHKRHMTEVTIRRKHKTHVYDYVGVAHLARLANVLSDWDIEIEYNGSHLPEINYHELENKIKGHSVSIVSDNVYGTVIGMSIGNL